MASYQPRMTPEQLATYHAGETYCCPTCGEWKDGSNRPPETRFRPCEDCARDTSTDCREILAGDDCGEVEIPGDLLARLNAEFDAIAARRAELATIRVSVNVAGYSALKNGGRSIEGWNGGRNV